MSKPRVNCIIPVHNSIATIERAVKSAYESGCNKIFVFDDASTDNIFMKLLDLRDEYPLWIYSSLDVRLGATSARNYLINRVDGGLIIPLDADDTLHDIAPLVAAWNPGTWVYGNHIEVQDGNETLVKGVPAGSLPRKNITGVTFLFHRGDWQKVGGYDPDFAFAEDYAFQCALTNSGVKPVYVDTTVYTRYMRPEGNERSILANEYWTFYHTMARRKYPMVFSGT